MEKTILLTLTVPDGTNTCLRCDSVRFLIPDGAKNRNAGGSIGIRPGHTDALISVSPGEVVAALQGETVLRCTVGAGMAMVNGESVTILTDSVRTEKTDK